MLASTFQLVSSVGLFVGGCALMYWSLRLSYFLTLLLAVPTGALLVRVFISQHDCGHGSFFAARWANDLVGSLCSVLTLTPYANWRRQHAHHHAAWNNLDKRYSGADIYSACMTVNEYKSLTRPAAPAAPSPAASFRRPHRLSAACVLCCSIACPSTRRRLARERRAVYWLNGALAAVIVGLGLALGFLPVLLVQLPVILVTSIIGVWLFAIQHRFDTARWERQDAWSFAGAALEGSSFLKLPKVLQWFSGNIGYHNVHQLRAARAELPAGALLSRRRGLEGRNAADAALAFSAIGLVLWDEDKQRLVRFRDVRRGVA